MSLRQVDTAIFEGGLQSYGSPSTPLDFVGGDGAVAGGGGSVVVGNNFVVHHSSFVKAAMEVKHALFC